MAENDSTPSTDDRLGSSPNSRDYDARYNFQGEPGFSNLPEDNDQLYETKLPPLNIAELQAQAWQEFSDRIKFKENAGRFVVPKENTYTATLQLVREGEKIDIHFDPSVYKFFDAIIVGNANRPDIFDPNHAEYANYETLRDNLAVLRNTLMVHYYLDDDGQYNEHDEQDLPHLAEIAADLGKALGNQSGLGQIAAHSLNANILNIEGIGAAKAYDFLLSRQASDTLIGRIGVIVRDLFNQPWRNWALPPREKTALSEQGLSTPACTDELCHCSEQAASAARMQAAVERVNTATPEQKSLLLEVEREREVVRHGHIILDWLRNLKFSPRPLEELLSTEAPPSERNEEKNKLGQVLDYFKNYMQHALNSNPSLAENAQVVAAQAVAKVLEHSIELLASLEKPTSLASTMQISSDVTRQPENWDQLKGHTVDRLMQTLKGGLEQAVTALEQQQQEMERSSEEAAERAATDQTVYNAKRKKKKLIASTTGAKQRRINLDLIADDRAAGQGRFETRPEDRIVIRDRKSNIMGPQEPDKLTNKEKSQNTWKGGLTPEAEALTKALGKTLKGMHQDGSALLAKNTELAKDAVHVNSADAVAPDDQPFAVRNKQQTEREREQSGKFI